MLSLSHFRFGGVVFERSGNLGGGESLMKYAHNYIVGSQPIPYVKTNSAPHNAIYFPLRSVAINPKHICSSCIHFKKRSVI